MNRDSYVDWNTAVPDSEKTYSGAVFFNFERNSVLIACSFLLLVLYGLICLYSASYPFAMEEGLLSYTYLFKQFIFAVVGLITGVFILMCGRKVLEYICPVLMLFCVVLYSVTAFLKTHLNFTETSVQIIFLVQSMYLSLFFANRGNGITKLRELTLPIAFSVLFFVVLLTEGYFVHAVVLVVLTLIMFACGSVGFAGICLLLLYILVSLSVWILSEAERVKILLNLVVPGYFPEAVSSSELNFRSVFASGSMFGKGLGNGEFKYTYGAPVFTYGILADIAEEFGFTGVLVLFVLFGVFIYCSYRSVNHLRDSDRFYSNFSCGLTFVIFCSFFLNVASVLGILPAGKVSLPLFSYSKTVAVFIVECALIYKMSKIDLSSSEGEEKLKFYANSDFEVGYES